MAKISQILALGLFVLLLSLYVASAVDNSPLQDFCVADHTSSVLVNGHVCKDPNQVAAEDFFFSGFNRRAAVDPSGSKPTVVNVEHIPGLNTLGVSMSRIDFTPGGINFFHTHPRASEMLTVLEGTLEAGFLTSDNRHITKILQEGDIFVFPIGLIHYQRNVGHGSAVAIAAFGSQNAGTIHICPVLYNCRPNISCDNLHKAFRVDKSIIDQIKQQF